VSVAILFGIMFIAFSVVGTFIAWIARRIGLQSVEDFYAAAGRFGGFLAAMTYAATTYSSFMLVGLVGLAYVTGIGSLGFELAYLLATIGLLCLWGHHVWKLARREGFVSPSELLSRPYDSRLLGLIVSLLYLVALIPYTSAQFIGVGRVFEGLGLSFTTGVGAMLVLSIVWTILAGMWSVAATDAFQGLWMIATSFGLLVWLMGLVAGNNVDVGGVLEKHELLSVGGRFWGPAIFVSFAIPWMFFAATNPQVVQRLYTPRNSRAYRRMVLMFAVYGLAFTALVVYIGLVARALADYQLIPLPKARDQVTPCLLAVAPPLLAAATYVGIVAASLSTVDSIVLSIASALAREMGGGKTLAYTSIVVVNLIAAGIALTKPAPIVEMSVLSSLLLLPLAPASIYVIYKPREARSHKTAAIVSILAGVMIAFTAAALLGPRKTLTTLVAGIPIPLLVLVASTIPIVVSTVYRRS